MLGTNLQFGRVRGEDRFYIPVKARKNQNQRQQQQQKAGAKKDEKESKSTKSDALKPSEQSVVPISNLDRFLKSTRPSVQAQYFSKVDSFIIFFFTYLYLIALKMWQRVGMQYISCKWVVELCFCCVGGH